MNSDGLVSAFSWVADHDELGRSLLRYGYTDYSQLHGARQSLHLGLLAGGRALQIAAEQPARCFTSPSRTTWPRTTCFVLTRAAGGGSPPLFSIRAYRHIARSVGCKGQSMRLRGTASANGLPRKERFL